MDNRAERTIYFSEKDSQFLHTIGINQPASNVKIVKDVTQGIRSRDSSPFNQYNYFEYTPAKLSEENLARITKSKNYRFQLSIIGMIARDYERNGKRITNRALLDGIETVYRKMPHEIPAQQKYLIEREICHLQNDVLKDAETPLHLDDVLNILYLMEPDYTTRVRRLCEK